MKSAVPVVFLILLLTHLSAPGAAYKQIELNGYAEWRQDEFLIVEGQRVRPAERIKFRGDKKVTNFASIPLGYEVKVKGYRDTDGVVVAREIEAKSNGSAMFEAELVQAFNEMEEQYLQSGHMLEPAGNGKVVNLGRLMQSGPQVDRVRRIAARLVPPYLKPSDFRIYVVENKEWNAMAAPNRSIYVFTGLLRDMDDDEVAIVLGHELVHATHEHSRKEYKKSLLIQLAAIGALGVTEGTVDSEKIKEIIALVTLLASSAWRNGYSRHYEDQADIVGLRYAYQGGLM